MNYYIIALGVYFLLYVVATYFTNANFRRAFKNVLKISITAFGNLKHYLIGNKTLVVINNE